jgi:hypothetical protein
MIVDMLRKVRASRALACVGLGLGLAMLGCGLDDVDVPDLDGPSTFGQAMTMSITPDIITADGLSTAFVQAELRDQNGRTLADREIFFAVADNLGRPADIGLFFDLNGNRLGATDAIVRTNGNGVAQIIYLAPPRTDATANQSVLITARPVGTDFNGAFYRSVRLELRSAEPRIFPQVPLCNQQGAPDPPFCNVAPNGTFIFEAPDGFKAGRSILFQATCADPDGQIVRYEWFFGDGTGPVYFPDTNHIFRFPGIYTVQLRCTDDDGAQGVSSTILTLN